MIIHSYFTDGLLPWAKLFVESFRFYNGSDIPIILDTCNLSTDQVNDLYNLCDNLVINNVQIDLKKLAIDFGITYKKLLEYKKQIEKDHITNESLMWKQYTSADQRIRSIYNVMKYYIKKEDFLIHWDIDMYIRSKLDDLYEIIENNDISIRFRNTAKNNRKVMGGLIGFKINKYVLRFMDQWVKYLDDVPIPKRKLGYGQTSFYYAYCDLKSDYKWGNISLNYISPFMRKEDKVWSANTKNGKTKNLKKCRGDFEQCKRQF